MQKWLLVAALAAFALGMSGSGSGLTAAGNGVGPPSNPPQDTPPRVDPPASLFDVSHGKASERAVTRTGEVSPVFSAASPSSR